MRQGPDTFSVRNTLHRLDLQGLLVRFGFASGRGIEMSCSKIRDFHCNVIFYAQQAAGNISLAIQGLPKRE